ncbi:MAG: autotransporter assembly complex protein TamA [Gammaproteobacteria bacterium]|nr:autotransporter assembly complex protein TamA [Gammaproteobacteria bacterium]
MRRTTALWALAVLAFAGAAVAQDLSVHISGVKSAELQSIQAQLQIEREKDRPDLADGRIKRLHGLAPEQIRRALQPFGYYQAQVRGSLEKTDKGWQARYQVERGQPVRMGRLDLRLQGPGETDAALAGLLREFPLRVGDVFAHPSWEEGKLDLQRIAAERGYLDATLQTHEVRVNLAARTAQATLVFDTGPRYAFGPVVFRQETNVVDPELVARYSEIHEGDDYTGEALRELRVALVDSGWFAQVEIVVRREDTRRETGRPHVPVEVRLTARKPSQYRVGIGYGSDTGARLNLGFTRYFQRRGHRVTLDTRLADNARELLGRYSIPRGDPRHERLDLLASVSRQDTDQRLSETALVGVSLVGQFHGWQRTLGLALAREDYTIAGADGRADLLLPSISIRRSDSDDPLNPRRGWRLQLDALTALGSDGGFGQFGADATWIHSLSRDWGLILHGEAGITLVDKLDDIPASRRFFAGGDHSVRGFGYEALGPVNANDQITGGKFLLVASVELERRLTEKWSVAVFTDAGNAFNDNFDPEYGVGIGVRWRSPVGPVRVDLAHGSGPQGDDLRLHLVIGPRL